MRTHGLTDPVRTVRLRVTRCPVYSYFYPLTDPRSRPDAVSQNVSTRGSYHHFARAWCCGPNTVSATAWASIRANGKACKIARRCTHERLRVAASRAFDRKHRAAARRITASRGRGELCGR